MPHRKKRLFNVIVLAIGAVALAFVMREPGWDRLQDAIVGIGASFVVIAAIDVASACCDAFAIYSMLRPRTQIRYRTAFAAQLSGMAINRLTPGNSLGEPVKVTSLAHTVPTSLAVSAVVMFNLLTLYTAIATIVIGVPITLLLLDLPSQVQLVVWIATALLVALAIALAWIVRRGAVATAVDVVRGTSLISAERAARWRAAIADIDAHLQELAPGRGHRRASGLARGIAGVVSSRVVNSIGTIVLLRAAAIPLDPVLVVAMLSVGILVTWISNVIPLGLGVADGTNYALYGVLGASPAAGVVYTMVNRLRTIVLALFGLSVMAIAHGFQRDRSPAPRPPS
ncbi:MAG TPA: lysylphosphatidylglycerol synthase transmembrane domain-containing protein [Kofleriaceae bacterium]|nr:lysylphosphatidylglycerol synthase transmembrane domain-containing protein [Kofleriaceae bacterium]